MNCVMVIFIYDLEELCFCYLKKLIIYSLKINELCLYNVYNINLIILLVYMYNIDFFYLL